MSSRYLIIATSFMFIVLILACTMIVNTNSKSFRRVPLTITLLPPCSKGKSNYLDASKTESKFYVTIKNNSNTPVRIWEDPLGVDDVLFLNIIAINGKKLQTPLCVNISRSGSSSPMPLLINPNELVISTIIADTGLPTVQKEGYIVAGSSFPMPDNNEKSEIVTAIVVLDTVSATHTKTINDKCRVWSGSIISKPVTFIAQYPDQKDTHRSASKRKSLQN